MVGTCFLLPRFPINVASGFDWCTQNTIFTTHIVFSLSEKLPFSSISNCIILNWIKYDMHKTVFYYSESVILFTLSVYSELIISIHWGWLSWASGFVESIETWE